MEFFLPVISFFIQPKLNSLPAATSDGWRWEFTEACHSMEIYKKPKSKLDIHPRDIKVPISS